MKKLISTLMLGFIIITNTSYADKTSDELALQAEQWAKEDEKARKEDINLNIFIDGQELTFTKEENLGMPFIDENKRTLVPLRKPVEMTGSTVTWDNNTKTATIITKEQPATTYDSSKGQQGAVQKIISIKANDKFMTWRYKNEDKMNEKIKELDTKAVIKNGRTYIPLRAILEMIGYKVSYNPKTRTITATNSILKTWNGSDEINKDFPNLIEGVKEFDSIPRDVVIDTLVLDNSYQDKMKINIGEKGGKWITLNTPTRDYMMFIKGKKVVYETDSFLDNIYYYWQEWSKKGYNIGNISEIDYMLLYEAFNPVATLIENPFKGMSEEEMLQKGILIKQ